MKWTLVVLIPASTCLVGVGQADGRAKARPTANKKVTTKAHKPRTAPSPANRRVSAANKARAKRLYRLGKRYFRQKKYAKAVDAFKKAYRFRKHPLILYNTALVLALQDKKLDAAMNLRKYRTLKKGRLPRLPKQLQEALDDTGVLKITTPDPAAAIFVDGQEVGKGSAEITALVGRRAVDIVVQSRIVARRIIDLQPDSVKVWELLEMPQAPVDPRRRRIRPRERMPPAIRPVNGPKPPVTVRPAPRKKLHWAVFSAATGVAVAAVGAAVGLSLTIQKINDDCRAAPCTTAESDRGFALQRATNALWGVAGGAAVAAAVLIFFTRWKKTEKSSVSVVPIVGPGNVGLTLTWER